MYEFSPSFERKVTSAQTRRSLLRRYWPVVLFCLDASLIYSAVGLAYWTRYILKLGPVIRDQVTFGAYQPLAILLLAIILPVLAVKSAYKIRLSREAAGEMTAIFSSATIAIATVVVITAMLHRFQYSRGLIVYLWVLVVLLLFLGRGLARSVQGWCNRRGWGVLRVLVVGATDAGKMVMQSLVARPDLGYQLVGFVGPVDAPQLRDFGRFKALGTVTDLTTLLEEEQIDEVIVALPSSAHEESLAVLTLCEKHGIRLKLVPDLFEMSLSRVRMDDIAGIPVFDVQDRPLRQVEIVLKRVVDIVVAAVVLVLLSPVLAVLLLLIKLESRGKALLSQERIGFNGKSFRCLKLRTMYSDAEELQTSLLHANEASGPLFKIKDDPRCTRVGRRIRRWSLDELPQMWNVLKGDMSLVGPRPALPIEVAQYSDTQRKRLEIKPGLTGLWQVSGRSDLPFDEMVLMDINYLENWSLLVDLKIVLRTFSAVLGRHGAY